MNKMPLTNRVYWLFLDLNSFFASCEQQDNPRYRGRPLIVAPAGGVDTTCAIAASYEAKRLGIKTNTPVWEARQKCPELIIVSGNHRRYVEYHHAVMQAIESCLHVDCVLSIDECACRLLGDEQLVPNATALAQKIKATIRTQVGACLTSSIGLAPNRFLAKVASNMQKPNGLTVLTIADLPDKILHLTPRDLPGIGPRMEKRLDAHGIFTIADLYAADMHVLRHIYHGIEGERLYQKLRGIEPWTPPSQARVIGHQHVLEPELRNLTGMQAYTQHMLAKAAERLRGKQLACQRLVLHVKWQGTGRQFYRSGLEITFHATNNTAALLQILNQHLLPALLAEQPGSAAHPFRCGIMLCDLIPERNIQDDLFAPRPHAQLAPALDEINRKYGRGTIYFGSTVTDQQGQKLRAFGNRIAFQRVPKLDEYN